MDFNELETSMKAKLISTDACGTDGTDSSKLMEIYLVTDDDGFQHTVRILANSETKNQDIIDACNECCSNPCITL